MAIFLIGIVAALYLRGKDTERYDGIGRFAQDGASSHDPFVSPELAPART